METTKQMIARKLHAEINANVDAYYDDMLTHAEFSAANKAIWQRAERFNVTQLISALLRDDAADFESIAQDMVVA